MISIFTPEKNFLYLKKNPSSRINFLYLKSEFVKLTTLGFPFIKTISLWLNLNPSFNNDYFCFKSEFAKYIVCGFSFTKGSSLHELNEIHTFMMTTV